MIAMTLVIRAVCLLSLLLTPLHLQAMAQSEGDVRLSGSHLAHTGRVEIYLDGQWGTVCDHNYAGSADVVCYQLNYARSSTQYPGTSVREMNKILGEDNGIRDVNDTTPILLSDVDCGAINSTPPTTVHILRCDSQPFNPSLTECTHTDDLAVVCDNDTSRDQPAAYDSEVRLVGGDFPSRGTLEMFLRGRWGKVCHRGFRHTSAHSACRQLGYTHAEEKEEVVVVGGVSGRTPNSTADVVWSGEILCQESMPCLGSCFEKDRLNQTSCPDRRYVQLQCGFDKQISNTSSSGNPIMCSWRKRSSKTPAYVVAIMSFSGGLWTVLTASVIIAAFCYSKKGCPGYHLRQKHERAQDNYYHTIN